MQNAMMVGATMPDPEAGCYSIIFLVLIVKKLKEINYPYDIIRTICSTPINSVLVELIEQL